MLLHDAVTCFLFFGYIFSNFLPVGTLVILLHDVCDFPFHISKALNASVYEGLAAFPFVTAQFIWLYFRLFCLPMIILNIT